MHDAVQLQVKRVPAKSMAIPGADFAHLKFVRVGQDRFGFGSGALHAVQSPRSIYCTPNGSPGFHHTNFCQSIF